MDTHSDGLFEPARGKHNKRYNAMSTFTPACLARVVVHDEIAVSTFVDDAGAWTHVIVSVLDGGFQIAYKYRDLFFF